MEIPTQCTLPTIRSTHCCLNTTPKITETGLDHLGIAFYNLAVGMKLHIKHENVESEKSIISAMSIPKCSHPRRPPVPILIVSNKDKDQSLEGRLNPDGHKVLIDTYVPSVPWLNGGVLDQTTIDRQLNKQLTS
jgi:hypothetical protein